MKILEKVLKHFKEEGVDNFKESQYTWAEIGKLIGEKGESSRKAYSKFKLRESYGASVEDFAKAKGINPDYITSVQAIGKPGKEYFNFHLKKEGTHIQLEDIKDLLENFDFKIKPLKTKPIKFNNRVLGVNLTDQHFGLDIKNDLFGLCWDEGIAEKRDIIVLNHILREFNNHSKIVINYLGDMADGLDSMTTRKRHQLPQNLNNKEQIRRGVKSIMSLVDSLVKATKGKVSIMINNMVNSNHGGVLDFSIGEITKSVLELKYPKIITYNIGEKLALGVSIGEKDLLLTHGYEEKEMKNGIPKLLTPSNIEFIRKLMKHNGCREGKTILMRADLHQHHEIEYNYFMDLLNPAYSPASSYIQHNYNSDYNGGFIMFELLDGIFKTQRIDF